MRITELAPGLHSVEGRIVNWLVVVDGTDVTLIDTGYPGDRDELEESLRRVGRRVEDVRAVLLTHAHIDHTGSAESIARRAGTTVYAHPDELAQLRGDVTHQVSPLAIAKQAWRPGVLPWAVRAARNGGLTPPRVAGVQPLTPGPALDVPGHPVAVHTPGHTPGSCCFHLPQHGVVASGDSLVTAHPVTPRTGPQLIAPMFQHDQAQARASLDALAGLAADTLVPGHGPVHRGPLAIAVATARPR